MAAGVESFPSMGHGTYIYVHADGSLADENLLNNIFNCEKELRSALFEGKIDPSTRFRTLSDRVHAIEGAEDVTPHFIPMTLYDLFYFDGALKECLSEGDREDLGWIPFRFRMTKYQTYKYQRLDEEGKLISIRSYAFPTHVKGLFSMQDDYFYKTSCRALIQDLDLLKDKRDEFMSFFDRRGELQVSTDVVKHFIVENEDKIFAEIEEKRRSPSLLFPKLDTGTVERGSLFFDSPENEAQFNEDDYQAYRLVAREITMHFREGEAITITKKKVHKFADDLFNSCISTVRTTKEKCKFTRFLREKFHVANGWANLSERFHPVIKTIIHKALDCEMSPLSETHAILYRGGILKEDSVLRKDGKMHSLSFASSLFAGDVYDGCDGGRRWRSSAEALLHMLVPDRDGYAISVPYETAHRYLYIPVSTINGLYFGYGELFHARTRTPALSSDGTTGLGYNGLQAHEAETKKLICTEVTRDELSSTIKSYLESAILLHTTIEAECTD